jgi:hypothetical protein
MSLWIWLASIVGGAVAAWWIRRRFIEADSYFEGSTRIRPSLASRIGWGSADPENVKTQPASAQALAGRLDR